MKFEINSASKDFDGLIFNYPNDKSIYNNGKMNEGIISTNLGLRNIKHRKIMVDRDLSLAQILKQSTLIYISTKSLYRKLKKKKRNKPTSDVSINNLIMTEEKLKTLIRDTKYYSS